MPGKALITKEVIMTDKNSQVENTAEVLAQADAFQRITNANKLVSRFREEMSDAKEHYTECKKRYEAEQGRLNDLINSLSEELPLFDDLACQEIIKILTEKGVGYVRTLAGLLLQNGEDVVEKYLDQELKPFEVTRILKAIRQGYIKFLEMAGIPSLEGDDEYVKSVNEANHEMPFCEMVDEITKALRVAGENYSGSPIQWAVLTLLANVVKKDVPVVTDSIAEFAVVRIGNKKYTVDNWEMIVSFDCVELWPAFVVILIDSKGEAVPTKMYYDFETDLIKTCKDDKKVVVVDESENE